MWLYSNWQRHLDEVFSTVSGQTHYLWRTVEHEEEVLESWVLKTRGRKLELKFPKNGSGLGLWRSTEGFGR